MATPKEKKELIEMIRGFYKRAEYRLDWKLNANESVAYVFLQMMKEADNCSGAFSFIPRPTLVMPKTPMGALIFVVKTIGGVAFRRALKKVSKTCLQGTIKSLGSDLRMASQGLYNYN